MLSCGRGYFLLFFAISWVHAAGVLSSLDGRVGLPEDVDPLHGMREPQFDINPLVQSWRDWDFSNVMFGMDV